MTASATLLALALPLCEPQEQELAAARARGRGSNVLLVTLDTTRADRLGCYGWSAAETPTLDQLARDGVLAERALAATPITLPSHTTILTGRFPPRHGVHDNGIFRAAPELVTLAELLEPAGYATAAFISAHVLASQYGLAQGFDTYDEQDATQRTGGVASVERRASATVNAVVSWLASPPPEPWFLWVHFFDPHRPFQPPEAFAKRFEDPYDGEIAFVDHQLKRLLQKVGAQGRGDRTLVIVTADHGEGLGDHDELSHGLFLYDATVRVPLILRHPAFGTGKRLKGQVSHADLVPTVLDLLGLPVPDGLDGASLLPALVQEQPEVWHEVLLETYLPWFGHGLAPLEGLCTSESKYVHGPSPELFHWREDPLEQKNRAGDPGDAAAGLLERLERMRGPPIPLTLAAADPLDPDERERMARLGYAGGGDDAPAAAPRDRSQLADPHSYVAILNARSIAAEQLEQGRTDEAVRGLRAALQRFPSDPGLHGQLGHVLLIARSWDEAIAELEAALALRPDGFSAALDLSYARHAKGDFDGALAALDQVIGRAAGYTQAYLHASTLCERSKDVARARDYLVRARRTCKPESRFGREIEVRLERLDAAH